MKTSRTGTQVSYPAPPPSPIVHLKHVRESDYAVEGVEGYFNEQRKEGRREEEGRRKERKKDGREKKGNHRKYPDSSLGGKRSCGKMPSLLLISVYERPLATLSEPLGHKAWAPMPPQGPPPATP